MGRPSNATLKERALAAEREKQKEKAAKSDGPSVQKEKRPGVHEPARSVAVVDGAALAPPVAASPSPRKFHQMTAGEILNALSVDKLLGILDAAPRR
ncbi:hypothetical protein GCM10027034_38260 [Ramlibacter solisilvae]|uniref:hypothetical protein n=1 Tax=Ramlibacter tataouinensis TaxID=94132 RepID=UPI0011AE5750|nr:hypothetical protein [Ramlibacter tataouinensis]